jgi:hypothetical protein
VFLEIFLLFFYFYFLLLFIFYAIFSKISQVKFLDIIKHIPDDLTTCVACHICCLFPGHHASTQPAEQCIEGYSHAQVVSWNAAAALYWRAVRSDAVPQQ